MAVAADGGESLLVVHNTRLFMGCCKVGGYDAVSSARAHRGAEWNRSERETVTDAIAPPRRTSHFSITSVARGDATALESAT